MGDGANDLKMMAQAGISIAYHAKPVVRVAGQLRVEFRRAGWHRQPVWRLSSIPGYINFRSGYNLAALGPTKPVSTDYLFSTQRRIAR